MLQLAGIDSALHTRAPGNSKSKKTHAQAGLLPKADQQEAFLNFDAGLGFFLHESWPE